MGVSQYIAVYLEPAVGVALHYPATRFPHVKISPTVDAVRVDGVEVGRVCHLRLDVESLKPVCRNTRTQRRDQECTSATTAHKCSAPAVLDA